MQRTVRELLRQGRVPLAAEVEAGTTLESALLKLDYLDVRALLVMDSGRISGIFTEGDFVRALVLGKGRVDLQVPVDSLMTRSVFYVTPDYRLDECMAAMSKMGISHLPVQEEGRPIALLTMRSIIEALVEDVEAVVHELTRYVSGSPSLKVKPPERRGVLACLPPAEIERSVH